MTSQLCTPEYNARTKEMMRQRDELRRIAEGAKKGDFSAAMRWKQKELVQAGETDAGKVVTKVRDWISQWADHSAREVSDALSGYGRERTETKDALQQRVNAINAELRDLSRTEDTLKGNTDPQAAARRARVSALDNQIAELERKLDYGDRSTKEKRTPLTSDQIEALKKRRDDLQAELTQSTNPPPAKYPKDLNESKNRAQQTALKREIEHIDEQLKSLDISEPAKHTMKPDAETLRLREELKQKKAEREKITPAGEAIYPKENPKDVARRKALQREVEDLKRRIATGDYDKPEKVAPEYTRATLKLQAERDTIKRKLDMFVAAREAKNLSVPRKIANFAVALHRAAILSGYHVLGKLAAYSASELVTAPLNSIVSEALRRVPGLSKVYEKAPVAGAGFVAKAEAARYKALVDPETWKRAGKAITQGFDDMDAMFGDKADHLSVNRWLEIPGRIHSAEKTPLKASAEAHARVLYQAQRLREMKVENPKSTDSELMAKVMEPEEQAAILGKAYTKGQEAILQNDNAAVQAYRGFVRILRGKEGDATSRLRNAIAYFLEYELPIVKVPANLVDRLSGYTPVIGQAKALASLGKLDKMTEAQAEYIARNLNNSTIGTVAALAGWYGYKSISGYYQEGDNKKGREAETATIGDVTVPRAVFHHPLAGVMQMWATIHRVYDEKHGGAGGAVSGGLAGARGAIEQLPFLDYITRQGTNFKDAESLGNWAGKEVAELIPQGIKDFAKDTDPAKSRKAKGFTQQLQAGIPGQREKLPQR